MTEENSRETGQKKMAEMRDEQPQTEACEQAEASGQADMQPIHRLQIDDREIILIGTAHVSPESAAFVKKTIDAEQPDTVCIELDDGRYQNLSQKDQWENTDLVKIIKSGKTGYLFANIILSNYQRKIAEQFGIQSGQEMLQAIASAKENNARLVMVDRPIQLTFSRIWHGCSFWEKMKLLGSILMSVFDNEAITEEELEAMKTEDLLTSALSEMGEAFPGVKQYLVTERDAYLTEKIRTAPGKKIVAVVGAAHLPGILASVEKTIDLDAISAVPPKSKGGKIFGWALMVAFIALIAVTFSISPSSGWEQTVNWLIMTVGGAGLGALLALAHPLSILTAMVCAPISALSPVLAAGWFSGIAEASLRKPKVQDFERLSVDLGSLKGFWKNKVTKVLLVVILTNIGCAIGNICGGVKVIQLFLNVLS